MIYCVFCNNLGLNLYYKIRVHRYNYQFLFVTALNQRYFNLSNHLANLVYYLQFNKTDFICIPNPIVVGYKIKLIINNFVIIFVHFL